MKQKEKRFFDIYPPAALAEKEKPSLAREPSGKEAIVHPSEKKGKKGWLVLFLLLLFSVGSWAYLSLSKAQIEITPKTEALAFKTKLTVKKDIKNPDFENKIIPGKIFEKEISLSQEFPSTGKATKESRAEGIIRVYNNYRLRQVLIANTRFQPPLEKFKPPLEKDETPWFRTLKRVVIPPKSYINVKVVADNPGEKYNIEPSKFSVPGLVGTPQYTFVYGESFEKFKGGFKKELPQLTEDDLAAAKESLEKKAIQMTETSLKNELLPKFAFYEGGVNSVILESSSLAKAGAELKNFIYQVKSKSKILSFKKEDLDSFAKNFILSRIPKEKEVYWKSLEVNYSSSSPDFNSGQIALSLNLKVKVYSKINENQLKKSLEGKLLKEAKVLLENQSGILSTRIKLWPFWVRKIPKREKINIKLNLES